MNTKSIPSTLTSSSLIPEEGWHVMHLYYLIDHAQWATLSKEEKREGKTKFTALIQTICETPDTQILSFAVVTTKADLGFTIISPDLQVISSFEKQLTLSLGVDILQPVYSFLSLTERSEYTTTREQYAKETLIAEQNLTENSSEYDKALEEFDERMKHYKNYRIYPNLPDWPIVCFYPMSKRRLETDNWYALDYESRRELMKGHAKTGRTYSGRILQLISGATGLDDYEWGVTLLAKDTYNIKAIVYEMRFDEVSAKYAEFGDFYIGIRLPLVDLFARLQL